jgi:hypothetical protein
VESCAEPARASSTSERNFRILAPALHKQHE